MQPPICSPVRHSLPRQRSSRLLNGFDAVTVHSVVPARQGAQGPNFSPPRIKVTFPGLWKAISSFGGHLQHTAPLHQRCPLAEQARRAREREDHFFSLLSIWYQSHIYDHRLPRSCSSIPTLPTRIVKSILGYYQIRSTHSTRLAASQFIHGASTTSLTANTYLLVRQ